LLCFCSLGPSSGWGLSVQLQYRFTTEHLSVD